MNNLFLTIDILTLCNYADDNTLSTSGNDANTVIAQQTFLVFQDVFSVTFFVFQDVLKTYLQYVFLKRLQDVFQDVFKTFSRRLQDVLEDKKNVTLKTSSVRLDQDECLLGSKLKRDFSETVKWFYENFMIIDPDMEIQINAIF